MILLPVLTGRNILFTPTANKKRTLSKRFEKVKKKIFLFFNSSFVYETCGNLESLLTGRAISDTYKFLDSRFRGNDNFLQIHHKSLINPEAIVLVRENNSRIEQAFPSAGSTFP